MGRSPSILGVAQMKKTIIILALLLAGCHDPTPDEQIFAPPAGKATSPAPYEYALVISAGMSAGKLNGYAKAGWRTVSYDSRAGVLILERPL
jgi:hypothetical protein